MSRFHGVVGYGHTSEIRPGVYDDIIIEQEYYGDITNDIAKWREGGKVNKDFTISNVVSILADAYAMEHYSDMRYISILGTRWVITEVQIQRPRLVIRVGDMYNGPTPSVA